jgi:hypothetical protein
MEPKLAMTVTGVGDDGREYTIQGFKKMRQQDGRWIEEALISITLTSDGELVHCESEKPLVFWVASTGMKIRCNDE